MSKYRLLIIIATFFLLLNGAFFPAAIAAEPQDSGTDIGLTEEERAFLVGKELRLGIDENRPPFEFIDEKGNYAGISASFIEIVSKKLGVPMLPQKGLKWTEAIEKAKIGEMEIIPKMTPSPERAKHLNFTRPYTTFPSVIVTRKDLFVLGLDDLKGLNVGVVKGLIIEASLKRDRPDLTLVPLPDMETALRELSAGKFDAFVDNLGAVTYVIDKVGLPNLKIAAQTPYTHDLAFAVRKDWPLLVSALDKALASISDQEKAAIKTRWLALQYQTLIDWKIVGPIVGSLLVVTAFVLVWNRRLGRAVRERERAEQDLRQYAEELREQQGRLQETEAWFRGIIESAPDGILVVDEEGAIILANAMVDKMFGYEPGELLGASVDTLVPPAFREGHAQLRERFMKTGTVREMGHGLSLWGVRKDGVEYPVEIGLSRLPASGSRSHCVCVSLRDVTERKKAEEEIKKYVTELERFNRLITGREIRMIHLKNEINTLRGELGRSVKYLATMEASQDKDFKIFGEQREESVLDLSLIGNIAEGRPNLGSTIDVGVYRLMQFSVRDVILRQFDPETAARVFFEAGELTGRELYRAMIKKRDSFDELITEARDLFASLKIGLLEFEKADIDKMSFTITISEDLDCSGMAASGEAICAYDEGFLSGLLSEHTGASFNVKEVNCWCSGDRLCRFEVKPAA